MGKYIKAADVVKEAFECAVIIIHHCGYEGTRPRGHSSLMGALDAQIAISRDAQNNIIAKVEYMKDGKDGPDGLEVVSRLERVELGLDDEGDEITSCVVIPVEMAEAGAITVPLHAWNKNAKPPTRGAKIAHTALFEAIAEHGVIPPPDPHIPAGRKCVKLSDWGRQMLERGICASEEERARNQAVKRAIEWLIGSGMVAMWGDYAWPNII